MAYRVAICDDSKTDAEYAQKVLCKWAQDRGVEVYPKIFSSAESFLWRYAEDKRWDILLLDIEMDGMDGVTMAKEVRRGNEAVQIVFITGYSDYIAEGYEVAALHYLMKPVRAEKLAAVLDRALEKHKQNERCLNLEIGGVFRTTKGENHGFGLVRMDSIIRRLNGYLSRNSEDGAFTTEILIPQM